MENLMIMIDFIEWYLLNEEFIKSEWMINDCEDGNVLLNLLILLI